MPDKKSVLGIIDSGSKTSFSKGEVKCFVNSVSAENNSAKPTKLKKGDVYITQLGTKSRPVVICKVLGDVVLAIPLSTTENELTLTNSNSRFFGDNFFSKQVIMSTYEYAMEHYAGVFDNNTNLNKAVKMMKQFYNEVL
tara:strand:- start:3 stop:419 length:417 start_codon:yes stop_codon:yes gene_type:complete